MQAIKTMKAMQLYGDRKVEYKEVAFPTYKEDEVLIKVHNVGVCATDLEIYEGDMVYFTTGLASFPIIPGHEWAGEIVEIGSAVTDLSVGDRVVGETTIPCGKCALCLSGQYNLCPDRVETGVMRKDGACAEYIVYPAHAVHTFHPAIPYEQACLIEPAAVSYRGVQRLQVSPKDRVAVIGGGPIGLLAVQMAKAFGAKHVTLVDIRENRLEIGLAVGADSVINVASEDFVQTAHALTNGEMFSRIIEATGSTEAMSTLTDIAAPGGRIVLLGLCGGKRASFDVDQIVTNDIVVCGSLSSPGAWEAAVHLLQSGQLKTEQLITHRFFVNELEKAFQLMEEKDPSIIKIVLNVSNS